MHIFILIFHTIAAIAQTTSIKDVTQPYYLAINSDGSLNAMVTGSCSPQFLALDPLSFTISGGSTYLQGATLVGDSGSGGHAGWCPAPAAGDAAANKYLKANGQWATVASGFSNPMTTLGDLTYEDATPTAVRLAGNTSSTKKFLSQTGNGSISAVPAWAQPAFSDLSGSATGAQLPNPSATTLGGIESYAAVSNQWINAISTSGVPSSTQPASSNLSDSSNIPLLNAANAWTANNSNSYAGTASTPAMKYSGAAYTAGSATTNKPIVLIEDAASSTSWYTGGTEFGVNAVSTMHGNLADFKANNASACSIDYLGGIWCRNIGDNSNEGLTLCGSSGGTQGGGGSGNSNNSNNCHSVVADNAGNLRVYSPNAAQGFYTTLWIHQTTANVGIGNAITASSMNQAMLYVTVPNAAAYNGYDLIQVFPRSGQTAPAFAFRATQNGTALFLVDVNGAPQVLTTASQPTCDATQRGKFWVTQSAAGVKDKVEVCAKDATDTYAWRTIY